MAMARMSLHCSISEQHSVCAEFHQGCAKAPNAGANIWTDKYQTEARGRTHISTCVSQAEGYDRMYREIPFDPGESHLPKQQQNKS